MLILGVIYNGMTRPASAASASGSSWASMVLLAVVLDQWKRRARPAEHGATLALGPADASRRPMLTGLLARPGPAGSPPNRDAARARTAT